MGQPAKPCWAGSWSELVTQLNHVELGAGLNRSTSYQLFQNLSWAFLFSRISFFHSSLLSLTDRLNLNLVGRGWTLGLEFCSHLSSPRSTAGFRAGSQPLVPPAHQQHNYNNFLCACASLIIQPTYLIYINCSILYQGVCKIGPNRKNREFTPFIMWPIQLSFVPWAIMWCLLSCTINYEFFVPHTLV